MKIFVDTHAHTVASTHAYSTVHDYFHYAKLKGLHMFGITDHAPAMPDSPHFWHFGNMKIIPRIVNGVAMLRGIEANILPENPGTICGHSGLRDLDIPPNLEPFLDYAIASFHEAVFPPSDDVQRNTQAMIRAIVSGKCQIVGHPGNPRYPINCEEVVRAAKDNNVLLEINNSSFQLSRKGSEPFCLRLMETVDRLDWKVVFASDAHIADAIGDVSQCIAKAESIGFPEERVLTATAGGFLRFLAEHNKAVSVELADWLDYLETRKYA